ncbi:MAG TPA: hypothetical protein VGP72_10905 [Planctomycetota bacterium]|jgi:Ca2+-binding EF-hand superfamily protein
MHYFDYEQVAKEANISPEKLAIICERLRQEYPHDEMMYELHVLRACNSVKDGRITLEELLKPEQATASGD